MVQRKKKTQDEEKASKPVPEGEVRDANLEDLDDSQIEVQVEEEDEISELKDKYMRLAAEFENYKKRQVRDTQRTIQCNAADLLRELLPILDNLRRAGDAVNQEGVTAEQVCEGVCLICDHMMEILAKQGMRKVEVKPGDVFDPNFMEAVSAVPTDEHKDHTIIEVILDGYVYGDIVVRPTKVVVAVAPKKE